MKIPTREVESENRMLQSKKSKRIACDCPFVQAKSIDDHRIWTNNKINIYTLYPFAMAYLKSIKIEIIFPWNALGIVAKPVAGNKRTESKRENDKEKNQRHTVEEKKR